MLLISLLGPLTMACFDPASDFAPGLVAPLLGGLIGGGIYCACIQRGYDTDFRTTRANLQPTSHTS